MTSAIAKLRFITDQYSFNNIFNCTEQEKKDIGIILTKYGKHLYSDASEVPAELIKELEPLADRVLENLVDTKTKKRPKHLDMCLGMYEL